MEQGLGLPEGTVNYVYDPMTGQLIETYTGNSHGGASTDVLYVYDNQGRLIEVEQALLVGQTVWTPAHAETVDNKQVFVGASYPTTLYT